MIKMPNIIHITKADDLSISNNQLVMIDEDNNDEKNKISLNDISAIVIENCHCKISAILQLRLVENNIPIIICNEKHQPEIHSLGLFNHFQVTLRINEQIEWEKEKKEKLWSRIVENKIENQKALLEYLEKSDISIERLKTYKENLQKGDVSAEHQEAIASRIYFQELYSNSFKRFDEDGVNSALNYGYMILRAIISSKIVAKGFHPSLGLHHKSQFNAYNFSDDIIEVFRPMVDYLVYMYKDILNEVKLSKEIRQKILLVAQQKVLFNNKKYDFFQAVDYYLDSIRNYFVKDEEVIIPTLSVMDWTMSIEYFGLLMYDFPMQTDVERFEYRTFRKKLIEKGYYQLQKSVYIMRSKTKEKIELAEKQLSMLAPENSSIRSIILTEEQFQKMKMLAGEVTMGEKISQNKILEF